MTQVADRTNWMLAPLNRHSFQRVHEFTRSVRIAPAKAPSVLREACIDLSHISFEDSSGSQTSLPDLLARTYTDGFLVLHKGVIRSEQYFNGMKPDTRHLMMSCSKSFTSALVGVYVESGEFDPTEQIVSYLPELRSTGLSGATIQNALDMQVGIVFSEDYEDRSGDWFDYELATGWRESSSYDGPKSQMEFARTLRSDGNCHGTIFHYQSVLANIVGCCLQRATGKSFVSMFAEDIWHPLGAENELISIIDADGTVSFEGGFNVCLRDFARFGQLIANDGAHAGRSLLPAKWIQACRSPGRSLIRAFAESNYASVAPGGAYHNGWWVRDPERGVLVALGINGQALFVDHEKDLVIAKFSSQPENENAVMELDQILAFEAIADNAF